MAAWLNLEKRSFNFLSTSQNQHAGGEGRPGRDTRGEKDEREDIRAGRGTCWERDARGRLYHELAKVVQSADKIFELLYLKTL
jgi:hypothetical protein